MSTRRRRTELAVIGRIAGACPRSLRPCQDCDCLGSWGGADSWAPIPACDPGAAGRTIGRQATRTVERRPGSGYGGGASEAQLSAKVQTPHLSCELTLAVRERQEETARAQVCGRRYGSPKVRRPHKPIAGGQRGPVATGMWGCAHVETWGQGRLGCVHSCAGCRTSNIEGSGNSPSRVGGGAHHSSMWTSAAKPAWLHE